MAQSASERNPAPRPRRTAVPQGEPSDGAEARAGTKDARDSDSSPRNGYRPLRRHQRLICDPNFHPTPPIKRQTTPPNPSKGGNEAPSHPCRAPRAAGAKKRRSRSEQRASRRGSPHPAAAQARGSGEQPHPPAPAPQRRPGRGKARERRGPKAPLPPPASHLSARTRGPEALPAAARGPAATVGPGERLRGLRLPPPAPPPPRAP